MSCAGRERAHLPSGLRPQSTELRHGIAASPGITVRARCHRTAASQSSQAPHPAKKSF